MSSSDISTTVAHMIRRAMENRENVPPPPELGAIEELPPSPPPRASTPTVNPLGGGPYRTGPAAPSPMLTTPEPTEPASPVQDFFEEEEEEPQQRRRRSDGPPAAPGRRARPTTLRLHDVQADVIRQQQEHFERRMRVCEEEVQAARARQEALRRLPPRPPAPPRRWRLPQDSASLTQAIEAQRAAEEVRLQLEAAEREHAQRHRRQEQEASLNVAVAPEPAPLQVVGLSPLARPAGQRPVDVQEDPGVGRLDGQARFVTVEEKGRANLVFLRCRSCRTQDEERVVRFQQERTQREQPERSLFPHEMGLGHHVYFEDEPRNEARLLYANEQYREAHHGVPYWRILLGHPELFELCCTHLQDHLLQHHYLDYRRHFVYKYDPETERRDQQWSSMRHAYCLRRGRAQEECKSCEPFGEEGEACAQACECLCHGTAEAFRRYQQCCTRLPY